MQVHIGKVVIQINCISRMEAGNNEWHCNTKNTHGLLTFEDVSFLEMTPNMLINDGFYGISLI